MPPTLHHPSTLSAHQRYRQARAILKGTSRASNNAWYLNALDHDFQLHIRVDAAGVSSRIFDRRSGLRTEGPPLPDNALLDPSLADSFANAVVTAAQQNNANGLGVILHVADEFATTEIKPSLNNPAALKDLQSTLLTDPGAVLDDSSLSPEEHSWRLIPYHDAGSPVIAVSIDLTRQYAPFLTALRSAGEMKNFPVVTAALSAPLVALLSLLHEVTHASERPFVAVLHYASFTLMAFFSEHGELRLLRTLQHRGQRRPANLRHVAMTTAAALETSDPDVIILPLSRESGNDLRADLAIVFPDSTVHMIDWSETPFLPQNGMSSPEAGITCHLSELSQGPLASSQTFHALLNEQWALQDFLPPLPENAEIYPHRNEMRLMKISRIARIAIFSITFLALAWALAGFVDMVRQPAWTFHSDEAKAVQQRLAGLGLERQRLEHWDNLLEDRSKAWTSMELLCRIFPDHSGIRVKSFAHTVTPDSTPGKTMVGFVKEWKITGFAKEDSLELLSTINTREGISMRFAEMAKITGNSAFRTDIASRSLVVNVKTQENPSFKPRPAEEFEEIDDSSYPFTFDLVITQRFEANDQIALNVTHAQ